MDDILDSIEPEINLTGAEIFTEIWLNPRTVFKFINENQYEKYLIILFILAGISNSIDRAVFRDAGDDLSLEVILLMSIFLGGLLGWISYYIYAALLSWTGKWLDGKADTKSILRVCGYATIPTSIALIFVMVQIYFSGIGYFQTEGFIYYENSMEEYIIWASLISEFILGIWSMIFFIVGISEVQGFSLSRAAVNLFLPIVIIGIPLLMLFFMLGLF